MRWAEKIAFFYSMFYDIITKSFHIIDTNRFYNIIENEEEYYE